MPMLDSGTAADRWESRASQSGQSYAAGVANTQKDPTALAAAQAQKMLNNVTQAITSGRWQRRLAEVGQAGWKAAVAAKVANYAVGVTASKSKYQAGYAAFKNYMDPYLATLETMPKTSLADSIARATYWIQNAAAYKGQ